MSRYKLTAVLALLTCWSCVPRLDRARMLAEEYAAIHRISTIHVAEAQYYSMNNKYAASLAELVSADILPKAFAKGKDGGYIFNVSAGAKGYVVTAVPEVYGRTGTRNFYSDETMVIRQSVTKEPAGPESPESRAVTQPLSHLTRDEIPTLRT